MGCKGIGFSFVRCKRGEGATYGHRHKVQEEVFIALKGDGTSVQSVQPKDGGALAGDGSRARWKAEDGGG